MATLLRSTQRATKTFVRFNSLKRRTVQPVLCRFLQTSKKSDNSTVTPSRDSKESEEEYLRRLEKWFADTNPELDKNTIHYGFDPHDPKMDAFTHKYVMTMFTIGFFGFIVLLTYAPNRHQRKWAVREAYFQLERKEKLGLPLVEKNVVDPSRVTLPSDEELGDYPIYV